MSLSNLEWRERFLALFAERMASQIDLESLVAPSEVDELRESLGEDPERAARKELTYWR